MKLKIPNLKEVDYKAKLLALFSGKSLVVILILLGIALNILSQNYFLRGDITENNLYSISSASKDIIANLEETVTLEVYFSENIPPNLSENKQNVLDLYEEYVKNSNGKITLDIKNPSDSNFENDAVAKGIRQVQFSELAEDRFAVAQGFFGVAVVQGDKTEALPVISNNANLEYETTSRILKVSRDQETKIGFLTGHGEKSTMLDMTMMNEVLQRQFTTEDVDLSAGKPIDPEEISVLVIASPLQKLSERDLFELEQYALKGGSMLVLNDQLMLEQGAPLLSVTENNTNDFLKLFGIQAENKVLLDESFTPVVSGFNQIAYPYWVLLTNDGINSSIPPLSELQAATLLWSNPLAKEEKAGLTYTELLNTTNLAWSEEGETLSIDFKEFAPADQKKYTVGYLVEGSLTNSFKDKAVPTLPEAAEGEEQKTDQRTKEDEVVNDSDKVKLVIIGDVDFATDNFINANEQNIVLLLNTVEWLAGSDELAGIRAKSVVTRPLAALENEEKNVYKGVNTALVPALLVVGGIFYLRHRTRKPAGV